MENEVTRRNIIAIKDHSETTRDSLHDVEITVENIKNTVGTLCNELEQIRAQLQKLQIKVYSGGATS